MRGSRGTSRSRGRAALLLGLALPFLAPGAAGAACRCVCFNGEMRALCGPIDPPAVCDRLCPLPTTPPGTQARAPLLDNPDRPDSYSETDPEIVGGRGNVAGSAAGGGGFGAGGGGSGAGASVR